MWFVRRNASGKIEAATRDAQEGYTEELPDTDPEVLRFVTNTMAPGKETSEAYTALVDRRARALNRKGTVDAQLAAINLKLGA